MSENIPELVDPNLVLQAVRKETKEKLSLIETNTVMQALILQI